MTDDDFLDSLKAGWRSQSVEVRDLASRLEARRRRAGLVMAFNLLGLASLAVLMLGFAVMAARREDALVGVAALAFMLATPAALFELLDFRRMRRLRYEDNLPGVLRQARDQAMFARRQLRSCRIAALLLAGSGLAAWALVPAGLARFDTVVFITLVWAATALLSWLWQHWRDRRLVEEIAGYDRLQKELENGF